MTVVHRHPRILLVCLTVAACNPATEVRKPETAPAPSTAPAAAPATPATFSHDPKLDSLGYYLTDARVQSGDLKLTSLSIGQASDFADWEAGERPATYAPIFMEFDDVNSPTAENELGQVYHTVSVRVLPTAYRVDGQKVSFHGVDQTLGEVTLTGAFDIAALKAAKAAGPGHLQPVMTGVLRVGDQEFRNITFKYFGGE